MNKFEQDCQYYREMHTRAQARRIDLETRGDDAISEYDKRFGYDLEFNLQLNSHHLAYSAEQLERCPKPLIEVQTPLITPAIPAERPTAPQKAPETTVFEQGRLWE